MTTKANMTDRELLEAAAKAGGFAYRWSEGLPFPQIKELGDGWLEWNFWSPLTDDGDALRLAVKLSIPIVITKKNIGVKCGPVALRATVNSLRQCGELSFLRRAIVRAAAAMAPE